MFMSTTLRITIASICLLALGFHHMIGQLLERVERQYLEAAEEPMVDVAHLLAVLMEATLKPDGTLDVSLLQGGMARVPERDIQAKIYDVLKTSLDMNVYIADVTGTCVYDSRGVETGQNLMARRDVNLTLKGQYGARSSRLDEKDDRSSVMYVGAPIRHDGKVVGAISIIKPQRSMFGFVAETQRVIRSIGWGMYWLLAAAGVVLTWWLLRPLRKLTAYAEKIALGERPQMPRLGGNEAAKLGKAFDHMRDALEDRNYVETYVQSLTHEMKSPVAAIRGAVELASEASTPPEQRARFLENIQAEAGRMQRIIDRLLALSEIESRKALNQRQLINLSSLVGDIVDGMRPAFEVRNVYLQLETEPNVMIRGDAMLLEMAVDNLLQNALDFSPAKSTAALRVYRESGKAWVQVTDQGPGIPDYALARVFERFYSLQHPATGRKSSGLGLCFVLEAAKLHGGEASVKNRTDSTGVSARLNLPIA